MKILVINGPNLNFLGIRDKKVYGEEDYGHLVKLIEEKAKTLGVDVECYQSNHEGDLIDRIQAAYSDGTGGIVINPGALTHYSYALYDALGSYDTIPMVEIHISDINSRDEFRRVSVTAPACDKQIVGHGLNGYLEAMEYIVSCREA
ncbi:MAG: 3-dehydroquinate dehydratase [Lachnospiraceae bacterium]|nr:3-dehydroquinate dehydratase [Lachnospiraceae bacterium]